ncbi:hypothetical protein HOY80DRAFT_876158, partial [Tuber brumale]
IVYVTEILLYLIPSVTLILKDPSPSVKPDNQLFESKGVVFRGILSIIFELLYLGLALIQSIILCKALIFGVLNSPFIKLTIFTIPNLSLTTYTTAFS